MGNRGGVVGEDGMPTHSGWTGHRRIREGQGADALGEEGPGRGGVGADQRDTVEKEDASARSGRTGHRRTREGRGADALGEE